MTRKFSIKDGSSIPVFSIYTKDGKELSSLQLLEILNALHEENEQLKHYKLYEDNKRLQTIIADLKEENEQLRKELRKLLGLVDDE